MAKRQRARRTSPLYLPSAFELFTPSKDLFVKYFNVFGLLYILPLIFWLHSWMDTPARGGNYAIRGTDANGAWSLPLGFNAAVIGFTILWFIIAVAIGTVIQVMMQKAQLDAVENREPTLNHCWQTFKKHGWEMFQLYVAMVLIFIVGFILFIIPGFFMIRRYIFAPYVMLDKKCGVKEALEESHRLGLQNTGAVWDLMGVLFLIGLIGIFPIVGSLASFVLGALYSIAPALRYQQLKKLG